MHLRQLAQYVGCATRRAPSRGNMPLRHAISCTRSSCVSWRSAGKPRSSAGHALLRFQCIDVRFQRTRHRSDLRREPKRNHLLLSRAYLGIRIESQRQQQRTRGLRMTTRRDDRFRQRLADLPGELHVRSAGIADELGDHRRRRGRQIDHRLRSRSLRSRRRLDFDSGLRSHAGARTVDFLRIEARIDRLETIDERADAWRRSGSCRARTACARLLPLRDCRRASRPCSRRS